MINLKAEQINPELVAVVQHEPATQLYIALSFQFGCSIGELINMGIPPEKIRESFEQVLEMAIQKKRSRIING